MLEAFFPKLAEFGYEVTFDNDDSRRRYLCGIIRLPSVQHLRASELAAGGCSMR
jgi:hypothetical protein